MVDIEDIEFVGFTVAKLARDRGFEWSTCHWYNINDKGEQAEPAPRSAAPMNHNYAAWGYHTVSVPRQNTLQRWLRENFGIEIFFRKVTSNGIMPYKFTVHYNKIICSHYGTTYEQGLEGALEDALKIIHGKLGSYEIKSYF